ncbi:MAG: hypothetical protein A2W23_06190 [Planctomycetes bacterium RBG_16_43_13]|nr:MAG: hypothetical protein A2W23_06190 [Planctomycetes bacterium RBG_16_43_13]
MGYLKETGQLTPEKQMEIEQKINVSYQRLLTFEVSGTGGFDWYGQPPAKVILSAYGILLLSDMKKVYEIDSGVIDRAYGFLRSKQNSDGSWSLDRDMHTWRQLSSNGRLPVTAYVTWALAEAGYRDSAVGGAINYIKRHLSEAKDPYVQALCANALIAYYGGNSPACSDILAKLKGGIRISEKEKVSYWDTTIQGVTYSSGESADLEATALATYAFIKARYEPSLVEKSLHYITRAKDSYGGWHSTQATLLCIKTLLEAAKSFSSAKNKGIVTSYINGIKVESGFEEFTEKNSDAMQQINISAYLREGENEVRLEMEGEVNVAYQIVGRYYIPWSELSELSEKSPPLTIDVSYNKTKLRTDDTVTASVRIRYNEAMPTFMVIADLGIPPGFSVEAADLERLVSDHIIDKYAITGRQITLYIGALERGKDVKMDYRLKARYPIKAKAPSSTVYEYYSPDKSASTKPIEFQVE